MSTLSSHLKPEISWELLPDDYILPDDPVENLLHPAFVAVLREILELAGLITPEMLVGSNFAICAVVDGKMVVKAPDWFYVPRADGVLRPNANTIGLAKIRRSYTPHRQGEPLAIFIEFLSDTEQHEYSLNPRPPYGKWYFYEQILQVPIYVIFDPEQPGLEVYHLANNRYIKQKADVNNRYYIQPLRLSLGTWYGTKAQLTTHWLRWWDVQGQMLPWGAEKVVQSRQAGIHQGKLELINRLLQRKFGEISLDIQMQLEKLESDRLDQLSEDLLEFSSRGDNADGTVAM